MARACRSSELSPRGAEYTHAREAVPSLIGQRLTWRVLLDVCLDRGFLDRARDIRPERGGRHEIDILDLKTPYRRQRSETAGAASRARQIGRLGCRGLLGVLSRLSCDIRIREVHVRNGFFLDCRARAMLLAQLGRILFGLPGEGALIFLDLAQASGFGLALAPRIGFLFPEIVRCRAGKLCPDDVEAAALSRGVPQRFEKAVDRARCRQQRSLYAFARGLNKFSGLVDLLNHVLDLALHFVVFGNTRLAKRIGFELANPR